MFLSGNFYKNDSLCSSQVAFWDIFIENNDHETAHNYNKMFVKNV